MLSGFRTFRVKPKFRDWENEVRDDLIVVGICFAVLLGVIFLSGCMSPGDEAIRNIEWHINTTGDNVRAEGGVGSRSEFYTYVEVQGAEGAIATVPEDGSEPVPAPGE